MVGKKAVFILVLFSLGFAAAAFLPAQTVRSATIDFSGLAEGAIVSRLSNGRGISGDPIDGTVSVTGSNPDFPGNNAAMIFDASCPPGNTPADCSGNDGDLFNFSLGNVLIISEDLDSNDPDDADHAGAEFRFDFSNLKGIVTVESLTVGDVEVTGEEGAKIIVTKLDGRETEVPIGFTGNGVYKPVMVGEKDVIKMVVDLNGSGAIDNIEIEVEEEPDIVNVTLGKTCVPKGVFSEDLLLSGSLKLNGNPVPNHAVTLNLPNGSNVSVNTDQAGNYSYLFEGARSFIGQNITARATVNGISDTDTHGITDADFAGCSNGVVLTLTGICEPKGQPSIDLRVTGILTRDGAPITNHSIRLNLPNESEVTLSTDNEGKISYLFKGAARFFGSNITAVATVDGNDYSTQHEITEADFIDCFVALPALDIQATCERGAEQSESHDLRLQGTLTDLGAVPVPNHLITIELPNGENISMNTDRAGNYSYLFEDADQYLGKRARVNTVLGDFGLNASHEITAADFEGCQESRSYVCHNVFLYTSFGQPIELGSQIPGWGIEDVHVVCKGIGQGKSCRLKVKGEPGYVVKSSTLEMDVPRLLPYVKYQAQIKGYDGAWTNKGCEFSFITGGHVASTTTHLSDQVEQLGWISLGAGQSAIKPLGVCSGWSDACLFAKNIIGLHLDDIYGNQLPGSKLSLLQPGDRISIYRDHRLYTYEFTGSERVLQSAEGNQAILDAAKQHDLVLTTCSGYRLIDEGHFSHTRLATFTLLPRVEPLYRGQ